MGTGLAPHDYYKTADQGRDRQPFVLTASGKLMAKPLTAADHREIARMLRSIAAEHLDRRVRQEVMLVAIEHEAIAEELERLEAEQP
jgi:hypothetical protein